MNGTIEKLKILLATFPQIDIVWLFGSRALGKGTPISDWDLAVKFRLAQSWKEQLHLRFAISELVGTEQVDLVDWDKAPLPLRYAIVQEGIILVCQNEELRVDLLTETRSSYWDFEPYLKECQDAFFRRIAERGNI